MSEKTRGDHPAGKKDLRYFIEIDLQTLKVLGHGAQPKQVLDKGRQTQPDRHRLFLTQGQYHQFVARCAVPKL